MNHDFLPLFVYENYQSIFHELSNSLSGFSHNEFSFGFELKRHDFPLPEGNFIFLNPNFSSSELEQHIKSIKSLPLGIYIPENHKEIDFLDRFNYKKSSQTLSVYYKQSSLTENQLNKIMESSLITRNFSFEQRGKVNSVYEKMDILPGLLFAQKPPNVAEKEKTILPISQLYQQIERIPRAFLHLFNGKFWILEDHFENFLASAITIANEIDFHDEKSNSIFYLVSPKDVESKLQQQILLTNIEVQLKSDHLFVYNIAYDLQDTIFSEIGYKKIISFILFTNDSEH